MGMCGSNQCFMPQVLARELRDPSELPNRFYTLSYPSCKGLTPRSVTYPTAELCVNSFRYEARRAYPRSRLSMCPALIAALTLVACRALILPPWEERMWFSIADERTEGFAVAKSLHSCSAELTITLGLPSSQSLWDESILDNFHPFVAVT